VYSTYLAMKSGLNVVYAITVIPKRNDSYMFHYPNAEMGEVVAKAIGLKPIKKYVSGIKEKEVDELMEMVSTLDVDGLVVGAIASKYQKERVDKISSKLGLEVYAPLWEMDPEEYMNSLIRDGFEVMIVGVYAMGIEHLLGRIIDNEVLEELKKAYQKYKVHLAGEGGEFETLVLDGPIFKKRIILKEYEVYTGLYRGEIVIKDYVLVDKDCMF